MQGDLNDAAAEFASLVPAAEAARDDVLKTLALVGYSKTLAWRGHAAEALTAGQAALETAVAMGGYNEDTVNARVRVSGSVALSCSSSAQV
jgi:hypothetical protein